mgnify:CR=1 FL=1
MDGVLAGAESTGARMVFVDDTWMYGRTTGWMTEDLPYARRVAEHLGVDLHTVTVGPDSRLFDGVEGERFYFVHSYAVRHWDLPASELLAPPVVTWAEHGEPFVAAVENGPLSATQFHPEKSGDAGARLLRNWVESL